MFIFSTLKNFIIPFGIKKILTIILSIASMTLIGGMVWKIYSLKNEKDKISQQLLMKELEFQKLQTWYAQEREKLIKEVLENERKLNKVKTQLEDENAKHKKELKEIYSTHINYIQSNGLYDPGTRETTSDSTYKRMSSNSSSSSESEKSCRNQKLSREASEFLLSLALEADELLVDYHTCYEWVKSMTENHVTP